MNDKKLLKTVPRLLRIESCADCPYLERGSDYSDDSFETLEKWQCKNLNKVVRRYVEWNDNSDYIPPTCPLPKAKKIKRREKT